MAKNQNNLIGGIILIAAAILLYELWKNGSLTKWIGDITGTPATTNTASATNYTGTANNAPATTTATTKTKTYSGGSTYTVQSGDTLSGIAAATGVSLAALEAANPQISNPNLIDVGQQITIPSGHSVTTSAPKTSNNGDYATNPSTGQYYRKAGTKSSSSSAKYRVQEGNNLYDIALSHGLTLAQIEKLNPQLRNPNLIYPGEEVNV
ncbi:LysM peptidoglycan-binding domain-containing protein [Sulfobacillus sp. hq2]|uniref:lytic transglycosylase n=1 Tax=Sulfobacillus TaxID=28033 RepID=UPI000CD11BFF|nr:LysM peptidoglycan-binding domain-containing protein [Sulfobacillus sp. hq2]POB11428.1 hypothetical protein CO251_04605 [Sulfobacillus sp. hq2]